MRPNRVSPAVSGILLWLVVGLAAGALLTLALGTWSNGFAASGGLLALGAVAWVIGPFKTPMAWSEGALMSYQGNADSGASEGSRRSRPPLTLPIYVLVGGALVLAASAALAFG